MFDEMKNVTKCYFRVLTGVAEMLEEGAVGGAPSEIESIRSKYTIVLLARHHSYIL